MKKRWIIMPIDIRIDHLTFVYPTNWGLRDISLEIPAGSFAAVLGPNGAGKSTLLKVLMKMYTHYQGSVTIKNKPLRQYNQLELGRVMSYVPQEMNFAFDFTVRELLEMGRYVHQKPWELHDPQGEEIISEILDLMEIREFEFRSIQAVSGGERRRVMIASALVQETPIILLDEPTTGLDVHHRLNIISLLHRINLQKNVTILMVTHDLNFAARYCDHFTFMVNGRIIRTGNRQLLWDEQLLQEIYSTPVRVLHHPYDNEPVILFRRD